MSNFDKVCWGAGLFLFVFGIPKCSSDGPRTDGVYESAAKKIDHGRAADLTPEEAQRLSDLMNWCKICKKPLRQCPHGK